MTQFNYTPLITGKILKDLEEQKQNFFYEGHPLFLIPDFLPYPADIWISYMEFLERNYSGSPGQKLDIYDQDGGEVHSYQILDSNTGLTKCTYTAYGIMFDEDSEPEDFDVEIEGYIMEVPPHTDFNDSSFSQFVFMATKVFESSKI